MVEWWCLPLALAAGAALHGIFETPKPAAENGFDYSAELHIKRLESDLRVERKENETLKTENESLKKKNEYLKSFIVDGVVLAVKR